MVFLRWFRGTKTLLITILNHYFFSKYIFDFKGGCRFFQMHFRKNWYIFDKHLISFEDNTISQIFIFHTALVNITPPCEQMVGLSLCWLCELHLHLAGQSLERRITTFWLSICSIALLSAFDTIWERWIDQILTIWILRKGDKMLNLKGWFIWQNTINCISKAKPS